MRRMNQADVVYTATMMNVLYERVITTVHDMEVLLAEAEMYCKDEETLAGMHHIYRLTRHLLTEGASNDD